MWRENHQIMMIFVEDMVEYGEFMAAVAPTAPVVTLPRLTTVAMAEETVEKSCIVPAAAAAAAAVYMEMSVVEELRTIRVEM